MSIFRRRATSETDPTDEAEPASVEEVEDAVDEPQADPEPDRSRGPLDAGEAGDLGGRLDLGSLWVQGAEGMELRLEVDQEQDLVVAATAVLGESAVQLQAFAAPKSGGLWKEIRDEIAQSIVKQGGTAQEKPGPFGPELSTRMPSPGPDGRTVFAPARFVGVDGPRWFLRAVFSGRAAIDDTAAQPLVEVLRETVVVRGDSPMAPRELLPLSLPSGDAPPPVDEEASDPDLNPFERGPEITEVR